MSTAPDKCAYCDGTDSNCGFCEMGVPLDTQEDWDRTWGRVEEVADKIARNYRPGPTSHRED